jgi:hypothetical protein
MNLHSLEVWEKAQELVINRPDLSLSEIGRQTGISQQNLHKRATRKGWLQLREMNDTTKAGERLHTIIKDVALQVNDLHEHAAAMVEALQNSYSIKIVRDKDGHMHYQNMLPSWPKMPKNFDSMTEEEKVFAINQIDSDRFSSFLKDLMNILNVKTNNIMFITKMIKNALPKIDPFSLDIGRRDADTTIDVLDQLALPPTTNPLLTGKIKENVND